jgi:riboflavin kinase/FMN adenylyltransferase
METRLGLETLATDRLGAVATVGFFDGVHLGHQSVFRRTVDAARARGLSVVAVTFDRHPREILTPGQEPRLLTTLERKAELIAACGIDLLLVLAFDRAFSQWPAEQFVDRVLVDGLGARHVVVGANFTFGHKAAGTLAVLQELGASRGLTAEGVELLVLEGRPVSSSSIRAALADGELDWPTIALGRRFAVEGTVVAGAGRGRDLGFPTANLEVPERMLLPGEGVYAGRAFVAGGAYRAAVNIGTNPTFGGEPLHLEAFLLDFDGDLRGEAVTVEFWARLRDEARFASVEGLIAQIAVDVDRTRRLVGSPASGDATN